MAMSESALEFLRSLFTDDAAQKEFQTDPEGTLERVGLGDCSPQEISRAVAEFAPSLSGDAQVRATAYVESTQGQGGFNGTGTAGNGLARPSHAAEGATQVNPAEYGADPAVSADAVPEELRPVVTEINYITQITQVDLDQVNNFTDNSVRQFIVAAGDVTQTFDNDTVTATDGGVAAAGNIEDAQINTGTNAGIIADEADNAIVGDNNTSIDAGSGANVTNVQGDGNVTGSTLTNSAVGDGNTQNIVDTGGGSGGSGGSVGNVNFGSGDLNDGDTTTTIGTAQNANVGGTQTVDQSQDNDATSTTITTTTTNTDASTTNTDSFNTDASTTNTDSFNTDASVDVNPPEFEPDPEPVAPSAPVEAPELPEAPAPAEDADPQ